MAAFDDISKVEFFYYYLIPVYNVNSFLFFILFYFKKLMLIEL